MEYNSLDSNSYISEKVIVKLIRYYFLDPSISKVTVSIVARENYKLR